MKRKILVTGSSGMIGTAFCEELFERNIYFVAIDKERNRWNESINAGMVIKDLTKKFGDTDIRTEIHFDTIVHLAANARVYDLVETPDMARDNILMTYNMLEFARQNGIKRFVFASSREVYGNTAEIIRKEGEVDLRECESPYTASKMASEALIYAYANCYGIDFIVIRFSNVYGRYDYNDRVIPLFVARTLKGLPLNVYGKAKVMDFTYIDDAVDGLWRAVDRFESAKGQAYNIAIGEGIFIDELARLIISSVCSSGSKVKIGKSRTGEIFRFVADINKAKIMFGYEPKYSIEEGIIETIEWYRPRLEEYLSCLKNRLLD